ncbi:unnamed protein product [Larinioides sclopetarius]|uniref:Integrase catalytic domain-containing protein n=1 Tax=Larinioides sclopetarius TaxID=280406 RepID=A0AAV1ZKI6_9ARAC
MTTDSFLLAFRRFLARRGNCKIIYSDNAKTFVKGKKEIENLSKILSNSTVKDYVSKEKIVWKNIIERSPWWGGFYERLVKSVKECLHKILGRALLNFEEMSTVLTEIEAVLNLRPLSYVYGESDEPEPLTPMHFINFGQNQQTFPVTFAHIIESESEKSSLLKRKRYQMLLLKQLWRRWKQQYLLDLRTAHSVKNPNSHAEFKTILTKSSDFIYHATRKRSYFGEFIIAFPSSWTDHKCKKEDFTTEISQKVDIYLTKSAQEPHLTAKHSRGCGLEGDRIDMPLDWLATLEAENLAHQFAQQWSIYRYGVFDEQPIKEDSCYLSGTSWKPVGCYNIKSTSEPTFENGLPVCSLPSDFFEKNELRSSLMSAVNSSKRTDMNKCTTKPPGVVTEIQSGILKI